MADSKLKSEEQVSTDESEHKLESSAADSASATAAINASKSSRKRTKTGCLTCRRRRIKCGEERPICNNCIKSKRNCEGYNPRAIFKEPGAELTSMLGNGYHQELESPIYSAGHVQPVLHHSFDPASFQTQQANASYTALAPRPSMFNGQQYPTPILPNTSNFGQNQGQMTSLQHYSPSVGTVVSHDPSLSLATDQPEYPQYMSSPMAGGHLSSNYGLEPQTGAQVSGIASHPLYSSSQLPQQQRPLPTFDPRTAGSALPHINARRSSEVRLASSNGNGSSRRSVSTDARHEPETEDDMDFEMSAMESANVKENQGQNVGLLIAVKATQRQQPRRPPLSSSSSSSLSTYVPSASASPLMNPETARIFCHFVTMTGPLLSIQERLIPNPALMFSQNQVPRRRQCIWTYTMPLLALGSPALLQAILAVSCLHIAKMKGESVLPSLKHYHMALRRVARCVSLPSKRNGIDVLGATMLLGYYEVASQEHNKWNSHLLGARQLLVETDFLGTTRRLQKMKNENIIRKSFSITAGSDLPNASDGATMTREQAAGEYLGPNRDIDESFLGLVAGHHPKFAHDQLSESQTGENAEVEAIQASLTSTEIDDYDLRCDLYWWYLKQDTIQSLISTNELLLNFEKWTDVPPRAPINRSNATFGTYDHLILIMGRLASFASKDVARKRRAGAASSGPWKLPSGVDVSSLGPPSSSEKYGKLEDLPGKTAQPNGSQMVDAQKRQMQMQMQMQGPPMAGMIPAPPAAQMPRGFAPEEGASPASIHDDQDLEVSTAQAEEEWVAIKEALAAFEGSLGEGFQPLPQEARPIITTPFGTAVFYASPAIALIWQWYHTALIIHQRVHPSMPPAAMIAAGISARQTAHSAIQIGRISAGVECLAPGVRDLVVDSAAPDIALGLFFAAIQYQDPAQRGWTVAKLRSMTDRVGWGTGDTIASGCERAWERAALMGRGPPYIRAMNPWAKDDRLAGRPFDPSNPIKDENDRRYMLTNPGARVHWALGVLGLENDVKNLTV